MLAENQTKNIWYSFVSDLSSGKIGCILSKVSEAIYKYPRLHSVAASVPIRLYSSVCQELGGCFEPASRGIDFVNAFNDVLLCLAVLDVCTHDDDVVAGKMCRRREMREGKSKVRSLGDYARPCEAFRRTYSTRYERRACFTQFHEARKTRGDKGWL